VTANLYSIRSSVSTTANSGTPYTIANVSGYVAEQGTFNADSTVTVQFGFHATSSITGATNNYGFRGELAAATGRWNFYAGGTADNYFNGNVGIGVTTPTAKLNIVEAGSQDALRVTNTGTGNSFVVEDSASTDATPFVIDAVGRVVVQKSSPQTTTNTGTPVLQSHVVGQNQLGLYGWSTTSAAAPDVRFLRSASGTVGTLGAVSNGSDLGALAFYGDDGSDFIPAAQILAEVDGTPGTGDMPGRIVLSTTADGASTPTERMRIDSAGRVGIGVTPTGGSRVTVGGQLTGGTVVQGYVLAASVQPDATSIATGFTANLSTQQAAFTNANMQHYRSAQGTFSAGSIVTNQNGFSSESTNIGATNNYGFYGNIAAATAGVQTSATVASVSQTGTTVTITTSAAHGYTNGQTVTVSLTANAADLVSGTPCTILTLGDTDFTTIGAASNTVGTTFTATGPATGTTGTVNINSQNSGRTVAGSSGSTFTYTSGLSATFTTITATGTVTVSKRYNFYANGTAPNYFNGQILVGATSAQSVGGTSAWQIQNHGTGTTGLVSTRSSADANAPTFVFGKSRSATIGSTAIVSSGDSIGVTRYYATDGAAFIEAANIIASVDGTPGLNDMPGRLVFSTTADGASTPTERMRITSAGNVGINASDPSQKLDINDDSVRVRTAKTPASATATGTQGQIAWDADYVYVCVATDTWKRTALLTWI
jgi:hypothetical protein